MQYSCRLISYLALLISICLLILEFFSEHAVRVSLDTFISIAGLLVTVIAFLVGSYFAVIAVSAYSHVREIEHGRKAIEDLEPALKQRAKDTEDVARSMVLLMEGMLNEQISSIKRGSGVSLDERSRMKNRHNELLRQRSLLAIRYDAHDPTRRMALVRELFEVGKPEDLDDLRRLIKRDKESAELVRLARKVYDAIEEKAPAEFDTVQ